MATPTQLDLTITFVRKFLREYARPSTIDDLLESTVTADPRVIDMLRGLRRELTGEDAQ